MAAPLEVERAAVAEDRPTEPREPSPLERLLAAQDMWTAAPKALLNDHPITVCG